jgi:hypothetical protein
VDIAAPGIQDLRGIRHAREGSESAVRGSFADRGTPVIDPGASATGVVPTLIDYFDGPLTYTSEAIGIVQR